MADSVPLQRHTKIDVTWLDHVVHHNLTNTHYPPRGDTPLIIASQARRVQAVVVLLSNGANVNKTNDNQDTALAIAAGQGYDDIVEILLDNGAKTDLLNTDHWSVLMHAVVSGDMRTLELLLKKCDVEAKDRAGLTPLLIAAKHGHTNAAKKLYDAKADPNATCNLGKTALMYAIGTGDFDLVYEMVRMGCDVNAKDKCGCTAMMYAVEMGNKQITEMLREKVLRDNPNDECVCQAIRLANSFLKKKTRKRRRKKRQCKSEDTVASNEKSLVAYKGQGEIPTFKCYQPVVETNMFEKLFQMLKVCWDKEVINMISGITTRKTDLNLVINFTHNIESAKIVNLGGEVYSNCDFNTLPKALAIAGIEANGYTSSTQDSTPSFDVKQFQNYLLCKVSIAIQAYFTPSDNVNTS
ncbi:ankyrin repeat domain-containing protein 24-like [Physella acuta]|uniref:ankyrin repeat domain-containing protein 24-like n=1 Tax=Physella acuta TaxID=109671 RepID=UPI0027DB9E1F|nr:ankyrin repeat domain-containing protein 24-like [Physella acuta]